MRCGKCGGENLPGAKFCKFCGSTLEGEMRVDPFVTSPPRTDLTTGCKVWFWILLVANALSAIGGIIRIPLSPLLGIFTVISSVVVAASSYLIMFRHIRSGLYAIIAMTVLDFVSAIINCITSGIFSNLPGASGILAALLAGVVGLLICAIRPALSYYFVNSNADIIK